ncbi:MAG: universal stress protein [Desulfobacteraceae bacterium]|nr:universal stress protein [Desulfobacteraceae bacterium]
MEIIKTVLVPLAMTDNCQGVFDSAAAIADKYGADILVVSVINSRDIQSVESVVSMGYDVDGEHYVSEIKKARKTMMDTIVETSGFSGKRVKILFKLGHPVDEILETIVRESPDLVVMGTRGRSGLRNSFIGDVAKQVFKRSPVPVLSHRGEKCRERLMKRVRLD